MITPEGPQGSLEKLVRYPANSKSRFDIKEYNSAEQQKQHCHVFLHSVGVNRDLAMQMDPRRSTAAKQAHSPPDLITPIVAQPPEELATDMYACSTSPGCTFTVEDKDPSVLWQMQDDSIFNFWYYLMSHCPERWEILTLTTEEALRKYRDIMNQILPKSLLGKHAFSSRNLPYAYFTIKFKCFQNASQMCCNLFTPGTAAPTQKDKAHHPHPSHTCPKNGHSCLRNIMSFKKLPGRAAFKRVGRAFVFGLQTAVPGYGIRDLSKGKQILGDAISKQFLRPSESNHACIRCGYHIPHPTLYTADAGQAYEVIKTHRIERACRIIFPSIQAVTGKSDPTISCQHTAKAKARFGGWIRDTLSDRSTFYLSKVAHCMRSLVKLRWFKFGNMYLHQKVGIPIGGPVSGAVLEAIFSVDEYFFEIRLASARCKTWDPWSARTLAHHQEVRRRYRRSHEVVLSKLRRGYNQNDILPHHLLR